MKRYSVITLAVLVCFVMAAAGKSPHAGLSTKDVAAVRANSDSYVRTALAEDWDAWGNTLSSDVVLMPPNQSPLVGRSAAVTWAKNFPKLTSLSSNIDEVSGRGDLAYSRGSYALAGTMSDGSSFSEKGSFLAIHHRSAAGTWPTSRLMWHADSPPATAGK